MNVLGLAKSVHSCATYKNVIVETILLFGTGGQVRLVRLQIPRLFLSQQTDKQQTSVCTMANGKRVTENCLGFRFLFLFETAAYVHIYICMFIYIFINIYIYIYLRPFPTPPRPFLTPPRPFLLSGRSGAPPHPTSPVNRYTVCTVYCTLYKCASLYNCLTCPSRVACSCCFSNYLIIYSSV
jgi:hypothetical protein